MPVSLTCDEAKLDKQVPTPFSSGRPLRPASGTCVTGADLDFKNVFLCRLRRLAGI